MRKIIKVKEGEINDNKINKNHLKIEFLFENKNIIKSYIYSITNKEFYENLITIENNNLNCNQFIIDIFQEIYLIYSELNNDFFNFKIKILEIGKELEKKLCKLQIDKGKIIIEIIKNQNNFIFLINLDFYLNNKLYNQNFIINNISDLENFININEMLTDKNIEEI